MFKSILFVGRGNPQPVINESLYAHTHKKRTLKKDKTRVVVKSKGNNFKSKKRSAVHNSFIVIFNLFSGIKESEVLY